MAQAKTRSIPVRIARLIAQIILWFIGLSLLLVIAFKWIPIPVTATMLMDENGITKDWESLDSIDPNLVAAVIAAEDSKFCEHFGFDTEAIEQAMEENREGGRIRGGSTISQQTAKNVFLWQGGGYFRKGVEAWFTFWIEAVWGKRRIMEVYLNVAETGIGTYGAEAGSQRYFGHSAARMSPDEASRMAAALPQPKKRAVIGPSGWLARHGNSIEARINVVKGDGLDDCVYQ
ncbi:monofunctional biosynthetic peptidoglycan transglycosylase [Erythrobacter sp. KY5]|uniref:monofunctional biosynthetic peptidoglycan transglycosylase n=1 Tax=Erythrobacter sp. KY5 TaxID=2011159 RepID=UPI000DBF25BB|nr:monofunctional biosynthetic peptidoglycan transglycosylase [Erythrobacter sp. KY5]AWW73873.1 monofunctional biosynthetic peptidoglycan transglycosylase [Erythrobacter sp. KY5]